jgi:hypothetical protein
MKRIIGVLAFAALVGASLVYAVVMLIAVFAPGPTGAKPTGKTAAASLPMRTGPSVESAAQPFRPRAPAAKPTP